MLNADDAKWLEAAVDGWTTARLPMVMQDSFVAGDSSGRRLSLHYFRNDADGSLRAKAVFGPETQGPPGHAHGGSIAALLDDAMGGAAWMRGHHAVAAELTTLFKTMLPLGSRCIVEATVTWAEGRKVRVLSRLRKNDDDTIYAEGKALFITLDPKKFGSLAAEASRLIAGFKGNAP